MKILLLIYIFAYTFCINEIYNITYSQEVEINNFDPIKPLYCDAGREFYLRLKNEDFNNTICIKFKLEKSNNIILKEVKAYGFKSYPSNEEIYEDVSNPLVNVLKDEFSHDKKYEYYTYSFLMPKNFEYASISIYAKNADCEYIGINAYSENK